MLPWRWSEGTIYRWLSPGPRRDVTNLIRGLLENPWLLVLWLGPAVWVGVALFEEVSRVFVLTRLWRVWPGYRARRVAVVFTAGLSGLAHLDQGPAGIASTGIGGLIIGVYFLRCGRLVPLVVSHALYGTAWILVGPAFMPRQGA